MVEIVVVMAFLRDPEADWECAHSRPQVNPRTIGLVHQRQRGAAEATPRMPYGFDQWITGRSSG